MQYIFEYPLFSGSSNVSAKVCKNRGSSLTWGAVAVLLLVALHPSILHVLLNLNYFYLTLRAPLHVVAQLIIYALPFPSLPFPSSLLTACVARDRVKYGDSTEDVGRGRFVGDG